MKLSEYERAIKLISEGEIDYSGTYDSVINKEVETIILDALREQAERSKGCEYCDTTQNRYLTDDVYMSTINSYGDKQRILTSNSGMAYRTLGFCPMCGAKMGGKP